MPLLPIAAILLGSSFLMIAGGVHGLILPLRGGLEGFPAITLGLLGTGWSIGYISGCLYVPRLVQRVGHVRTFSVMAAVAVVSILLQLSLITPAVWILVRGFSGFAFSGAAMIVESWLNEKSENTHRGRVFAIYTMVNLASVTIGQMAITLGDPGGFILFIIPAIFYALALIPTAVSSASAPKPLVEAGLDLKGLWRNSPIAVVAAFLIGMSNSSFGTLGVVFGGIISLDVTVIALMMSVSILAGALFQIPVGYFSDKMDRRIVLIAIMAIAASVDLFLILALPTDPYLILVTIAIFGAAIYSAYPIIVAHASDHAKAGNFLKISGGLLLMFGTGGVIGPLAAGLMMEIMPARGLFITTLTAHLIILGYAMWRIRRKEAVAEADKTDFVGIVPGRLATPETAALDPRNPGMNDPRMGDPEERAVSVDQD
jgi:MFS family permease